MNKIILMLILTVLTACGGKHENADLIAYLQGGSRSYGTFDCYGNPDGCTRGVSILKQYIATADSLPGLLTAKADPSKVLITLFDQNINDPNLPDTYVYLVDTKCFAETFEDGFSALDVVAFLKSSQLIARTMSGASGMEGYDPSVGGYWKDDNGNYYFSENGEIPKDVESIGFRMETTQLESIKESLLQYGLSIERTEKLAKLMAAYKKISNKRSLQNAERDYFTEELLGMDFEQASKQMVLNYDSLIQSAADKNGTSPEAVKELINDFLIK